VVRRDLAGLWNMLVFSAVMVEEAIAHIHGSVATVVAI
jgi:hypothetical protein